MSPPRRREESQREVDGELVRRAASGDVAAYEVLYRAHVGRVFALCARMARDRSAAEGLVQDVFVRVWERLGSFRGDAAFATWLHRVAVNVVVEDMRAKGRLRERFDAEADVEMESDASFFERAGSDVDLERAIARLPERARLVFVLHDVEGHKHAEIAELTGLAVGTSKAHLHRARSLLRAALAGESAAEEETR